MDAQGGTRVERWQIPSITWSCCNSSRRGWPRRDRGSSPRRNGEKSGEREPSNSWQLYQRPRLCYDEAARGNDTGMCKAQSVKESVRGSLLRPVGVSQHIRHTTDCIGSIHVIIGTHISTQYIPGHFHRVLEGTRPHARALQVRICPVERGRAALWNSLRAMGTKRARLKPATVLQGRLDKPSLSPDMRPVARE